MLFRKEWDLPRTKLQVGALSEPWLAWLESRLGRPGGGNDFSRQSAQYRERPLHKPFNVLCLGRAVVHFLRLWALMLVQVPDCQGGQWLLTRIWIGAISRGTIVLWSVHCINHLFSFAAFQLFLIAEVFPPIACLNCYSKNTLYISRAIIIESRSKSSFSHNLVTFIGKWYRVFYFTGPTPKSSKYKIMLEYLDWSRPKS